jgi:hypothetical protein
MEVANGRQPTYVQREAIRRHRVERFVIAAALFGAGYWVAGLHHEPAPPAPSGWTVRQLTEICPLLADNVDDPATVSGCHAATDRVIDRMGRDAAREVNNN